ncbi:hypothetical protein EJM73_08635 [Clostridium botulinum]|uniref:hypothetical protein n=1 Tax=Clostridium botulinum TaxID=1491 RepID=UPI001375993E|nr:hypothetical protein [Clostridium botulinum]NCI19690.1 hypothetical protein [Clostridium botulinum]NCI35728.1 hypothetical protein [Clostridium botulinum]NCI71585.1 hypothetical protein [Clostridium botulinum]NDI38777.1 hypothetical protein [Clostridium botulinum]
MNKGSIYFDEFKDIFHNPEMSLKDDGLNLLHEFVSDSLNMIQKNKVEALKQILHCMETEIEDYNFNNDRCPKCNEELIVITKRDNERLEHFGTECSQLISFRKCPSCGWKDDD